jgi:hypothetical protein
VSPEVPVKTLAPGVSGKDGVGHAGRWTRHPQKPKAEKPPLDRSATMKEVWRKKHARDAARKPGPKPKGHRSTLGAPQMPEHTAIVPGVSFHYPGLEELAGLLEDVAISIRKLLNYRGPG